MSNPIPGLPGGGKYKPYIDQLVEIAESKRKPLDMRLEQSNLQKDILEENRADIAIVQNSLKQLFGLDSVFRQNIAESSNPNVATAEASRDAKPVDMELLVKQIAAADRFYTKELPMDFQVPAGDYQFFVGEKEISLNYEGGTLDDFAAKLSKVEPEYLKGSVIRSSSDQQTLLIESLKTGADNRLNFEKKAKDFAFDTELITDEVSFEYIVASDNGGLQQGSTVNMAQEMRLSPGRYLDMTLNATAPLQLREGAYLNFEYTKKAETSDVVYYPPEPPAISKSEALKEGFLVPMQDEGPINLPRLSDDTNIYLIIDGKLTPVSSLGAQDSYGKMNIDLSSYKGEVQGMVLRNQSLSEAVEIRNVEFSTPSDIDFSPVKPASMAQDAEFTLDGVEVKRPTNHIDDLNPEVKLNLLSSSTDPVHIVVKPDFDKGEEAIKNFIVAYNYYISKLNIATAYKENKEILEEINFDDEKDREDAEKKLGVYQGDMQLVQMKNSMFGMMINPYQVSKDPERKMVFSQMGISTNNSLTGYGDPSSRRGYFQIDEKKLRAALESSWDDVREFFASKNGETVIPNDGLAVKMSDYLTPFSGRDGLMSKRIEVVDTRIKRQEKEIDDFNEKIKDQKQKWERDFMKVESAEAQLERLKKQMDGFFPGNK